MRTDFCVLLILDGFGENPRKKGNAVKEAGTPFLDYYKSKYPYTSISASEEPVGLVKGQMGDSEVGHMNIGAGRVVYQNLLKLNLEIDSGIFFKNPEIIKTMEHVKKNNSALHLMGLISDGGVHSHYKHLLAYLDMAKKMGLKKVFVHAVTDGRDTYYKSTEKYLLLVDAHMKKIGLGKFASVCGRFFAMDREHNYDRTKKFYDMVIFGKATPVVSIYDGIKQNYKAGITDEFIEPCIVDDGGGAHTFKDNDAFILVNFRKDRPIQFLESLTDTKFKEFETKRLKNFRVQTTTEISAKFKNIAVAYADVVPQNTLSEVISKNGFSQLKIAETTKYAHVTYYLNGTIEKPYKGEDRKLFESDKIPNFAVQPKMQAQKISQFAISSIKSHKYKLITINIANGDMIGHTGDYKAALEAVKEVDLRLNEIAEAALEEGGTCIITADHGNIEEMFTRDGKVSTQHSIFKVPFVVIDDGLIGLKLKEGGKLGDIAPTILKILKIKQPKEMTGISLL
ncbi:MAG: 2,3-bisphosphoglycerate-independent phosphoglycerate mutase [Christensenellaceae bacterium]|jgi:2,3-bisphosphoglycerate-independent phosphoglycerate mutase|nr:2,3-bisphosphoglycerate-independent phosphoglycerate mutase [Christensenellaceae bacterium]